MIYLIPGRRSASASFDELGIIVGDWTDNGSVFATNVLAAFATASACVKRSGHPLIGCRVLVSMKVAHIAQRRIVWLSAKAAPMGQARCRLRESRMSGRRDGR